jgi:hypothetical protein
MSLAQIGGQIAGISVVNFMFCNTLMDENAPAL